MELFQGAMALSASYIWLFVFCYFGEKVTGAFDKLSDCIYQTDWYRFPVELRKYVVIMLLFAQKPVYMLAFKKFQCTLRTFEQVNSHKYWFEI